MAASDPELIEKLNRLHDENYHKLIRATSILEAADSIEKELANYPSKSVQTLVHQAF